MSLETLAIHAGGEPDAATGAVVPSIHLTTMFQHGPAAERIGDYEYQRQGNAVRDRHGRKAALAMAGRLRLLINATSLDGCETLVEHRASVEGGNPVSPQNLLRLSVDLEHPGDLIADLQQALAD